MIAGVDCVSPPISEEYVLFRERELRENLEPMVHTFVDGYRQLRKNPARYIIESKKDIDEVSSAKITRAAKYANVLTKERLNKLLWFAVQFGIPLSPIGLYTTNSGAAAELSIEISDGLGSREGGIFGSKDNFKSGPSSKAGIWLVKTASVTDQIRADMRNMHEGDGPRLIGEWTYKDFPPTKREGEFIDLAGAHEGLHGTNEYLPITQLDDYEEIFHNRAAFLVNFIPKDQLKNVVASYFRTSNKSDRSLLDRLFDITFRSTTQEYVGLLTWRALLAPDIETFISNPNYLQQSASRLLEFSRKRVLPNYSKQLTELGR